MNQTQTTHALHREKTSSSAAHFYNSHTMFSNSSESEKVPPLDISHQFSLVLYILIVVLGITGNSMVIYVAGLKIKPNITNVWLVNLAVADLIFCITRIFSVAYRLQSNNWSFGSILCKFNGFFKYTNMFCSVFFLAVISVDRALCVWRPVFAKTKRTLLAARIVAVCVWILAIIFSAPFFIYRHIKLEKNKTKCSIDEGQVKEAKLSLYCIRFLCGFLFPFIVILVCYILTGLGLKRTNLSRKSRSLKILVTLVIAFFFCWAPYHCLQLVKMVDKYDKELKSWQRITSSIAYFNSCVNPILYYCMGANVGGRFRHRLFSVFNRAIANAMEEQTFQGEDNNSRSDVISQV